MRKAERLKMDHLLYRKTILNSKLQKKSLKYITGHSPCPDDIRNHFEKDWHFITILRDPIERFISAYFFNRYKKSKHRKHNLSLDDYLESTTAKDSGKLFLKYFANEQNMDNEFVWEEAVSNLKKFSVLGVLENMSDFKVDYEKKTGKQLGLVRRKNTNPINKNIISTSVTNSQMGRIREICETDIKIYEALNK